MASRKKTASKFKSVKKVKKLVSVPVNSEGLTFKEWFARKYPGKKF